jgi:hypothetical protein
VTYDNGQCVGADPTTPGGGAVGGIAHIGGGGTGGGSVIGGGGVPTYQPLLAQPDVPGRRRVPKAGDGPGGGKPHRSSHGGVHRRCRRSEGGPMSILFAATYPKRTTALVMYGTYAKRAWTEDHPFGWRDEEWDAFFANVENHWGTPRGVDLKFGHRASSATSAPAKRLRHTSGRRRVQGRSGGNADEPRD